MFGGSAMGSLNPEKQNSRRSPLLVCFLPLSGVLGIELRLLRVARASEQAFLESVKEAFDEN